MKLRLSCTVALLACALPSLAQLPGPSNTGYLNAPGYSGSLGACPTTITSNTTYNYVDCPSGITVPSGVSNVTFYGSRFRSNAVVFADVYDQGTDITFNYCTFMPSVVSSPPTSYNNGYQYGIDQTGGGLTLTNSDLWGWGNAVQIGSPSSAHPDVFRGNYFHDSRSDGGVDHTDAILDNYGNSYITIDHNWIVANGNTNAVAMQGSHYSNITITNNYTSGFGYTNALGVNSTNTNFIFAGNIYGNDIQPTWGPLREWISGTGNVWKCNYVHAPTSGWKAVNTGGSQYTAWVPSTSDDGKFWMPDNSNVTSTTDYNGNTDCSAYPDLAKGGTSPSAPTGLTASVH